MFWAVAAATGPLDSCIEAGLGYVVSVTGVDWDGGTGVAVVAFSGYFDSII